MEQIFIKLFDMSITAGWMVLVTILLRFALKGASKNIRCILWAMVAVRLVCPVSPESRLSLVPGTEIIHSGMMGSLEQMSDNSSSEYKKEERTAFTGTFTPAGSSADNTDNHHAFLLHIAVIVWLSGVAALMLYAVISYVRLHKKIAEGVVLKDNIWLCDRISTPFIWGIRKPRIILPSTIQETYIAFIVAHEKAHLSRCDHLWKPFGFLLVAVYWFNPLIWAAYFLFCRDIELACDERVIKELDMPNKKAYSSILLACSTNQNILPINPVAFGETGIKERIKAIMKYKKPKVWLGAASAVICVAVMVCCLTNPEAAENKAIDSKIYKTESKLHNDNTNKEQELKNEDIPQSGQIYGYIEEMDEGVLIVDRQYWITPESEDWKLEYNDAAGFAVVDAKEEALTYKISKNCTYSILEHHQSPRVELDANEFMKEYKKSYTKMEYPALWVITLKNNKVTDISEQYRP